MSHKTKQIKMKRNVGDVCTVSQVGEFYVRRNFEPQKCLDKNRVKGRRSAL
jgi:hypothetical protein